MSGPSLLLLHDSAETAVGHTPFCCLPLGRSGGGSHRATGHRGGTSCCRGRRGCVAAFPWSCSGCVLALCGLQWILSVYMMRRRISDCRFRGLGRGGGGGMRRARQHAFAGCLAAKD